MSGYHAGFLLGSALAPRLVARAGHVRVFAALAALRALDRDSPTGVVGYFGTMLATGADFGMGTVYGRGQEPFRVTAA